MNVPFVVWGCQSGCAKWWLYEVSLETSVDVAVNCDVIQSGREVRSLSRMENWVVKVGGARTSARVASVNTRVTQFDGHTMLRGALCGPQKNQVRRSGLCGPLNIEVRRNSVWWT